jgi:hypothetical protein
MANLLKQLELDELSLVDRPANAQAMVSLFKRDNSQEDDMTKETLEKMGYDEAKVKAYMEEKGCGRDEAMKALNMEEPMEKADEEVAAKADEIDARDAEIDALKADNENLRKALIENGFVIKADTIEKKAEPEYMEYDGEQINKADIPAPILKALEEAEFAKADAELTKRATEALPHFATDVAKSLVGEFGEVESIMEALKAADATFAANMEEVGKSAAETEFATAHDKLESLVKAYMDENQMKKSEYAKAYAAVAKTDEGKTLINKSYKGE